MQLLGWHDLCPNETVKKTQGGNMATFTVISIVDGDTFDVSPEWKWNGQTGNRVRPTGYDAPELYAYGGQAAREKLSQLILNQKVELGSAYKIDHGRLVCDVFFNNHNLADYFPNWK